MEQIRQDQANPGGSRSSQRARPMAPRPRTSGLPRWPHRHADSGSKHEAMGEGDLFTTANRKAHASIGRLTGGISPIAFMQAFTDWGWHLSISPGKQALLVTKMVRKTVRLRAYLPEAVCGGKCRCIEPLPHDDRFDDEEWRQWPYNLMSQSFLLTQQWWHNVAVGVDGVSPHHEDINEFVFRQIP